MAVKSTLYAGFIIALIVVAALAYFAGLSTAPTKTVTITKTITMTPTTKTVTITVTETIAPTKTPAKPTETKPTKAVKQPKPAKELVKVIEVSNAIIVVAPKDVELPKIEAKGKKLIIVRYEVDWTKTKPVENSTAFVDINPAFYRNVYADALIMAARKTADPTIREALYEAIYKISNEEVPILWLGQYKLVRVYWSWLHGRYYHPTLAERYDLLWEDASAPKVPIGVKDYVNDHRTYVIVTIGWPDTFDPAADYETFGWAIWHNIGDTLVTYWKDETREVVPDLAVAWAHDENATTWYFVIRGGVKAYDPWHNKTYDISAIDVLFTIWRIARLRLDPSWMITEFIDVNASKVLSEEEFEKILASGQLIAEYRGKRVQPKSLDELLKLFGYSGETAGVVMLKLYFPYAPILSILADPFTSVIPMKYLFDNVPELKGKYEEALEASNYGKNPAAWAKYIGTGENEPTHLYLHKYPVGTGPYYVAEYKQDSYIVLKYNPYYWNATLWRQEPYGVGGKPVHETVIYLINNDPVSRIELLKKGVGDTAVIPLDRLKDVEGHQYPGTKFRVVVERGTLQPTIVFIVLNTAREPFNNKLVRKALMYAIPFEQIRDVVYAGMLERLYGVIPAGFPGHNDEIVEHYKFNLAKAKMLIKQSGIDPTKYTIEIWYNQGNTQREKIATLLQQTWSQLGFKVAVRPLSWPTLLSRTEKGDFQVYIIGWAPDYLDPDNYAGPLFYGGTRFSYLTVTVQG